MKIAFDVDGTIYKISDDKKSQVPDYDLIQVLRWFAANGDDVYVWSGGGIGYAQLIVDRLGLTEIVKVIPKLKLGDDKPVMNLTFDDEAIKNGDCNIRVKRPDYNAGREVGISQLSFAKCLGVATSTINTGIAKDICGKSEGTVK